jgi:hypothetical protein
MKIHRRNNPLIAESGPFDYTKSFCHPKRISRHSGGYPFTEDGIRNYSFKEEPLSASYGKKPDAQGTLKKGKLLREIGGLILDSALQALSVSLCYPAWLEDCASLYGIQRIFFNQEEWHAKG